MGPNELIEKAKEFASLAHAGQVRKYTGEPYYIHTQRVGDRVYQVVAGYSDYPLSTSEASIVAAAYLHDVCEDCSVSYEELEQTFNTSVAEFVSYLTNPPAEKAAKLSRAERKKNMRERLRTAPSMVQLIKAIDRLDNLFDMRLADNGFKVLYVGETLELITALPHIGRTWINELLAECAKLLETVKLPRGKHE